MTVVSGGADDPIRRIEAQLADRERALQRAFFVAIDSIRDEFSTEDIASMVEAGSLAPLLAAIEPASRIFAAEAVAAVVESAVETAAFITEDVIVGQLAFDRAEARVFQILADERNRLIRIFTAEQNQVVTQALQEGFTNQWNPRETAREIRESIGITPKQQQHVSNFREQLRAGRGGSPSRSVLRRRLRDRRFDRTLERAMREGEPLSDEQIDAMVERYHERYVKYHAEVVARTEALSSVHQGNRLAYAQAIEEGRIEPNQLLQTWVTARDERVRESHQLLNGEQRRGFGDEVVWQAIGGSLRFPGDPWAPLRETAQCRCIVTFRIREEGEEA